MPEKIDVIIVGAGAAGITAAIKLSQAGLSVTLLEARKRLGGRMLTLHDKTTGAAIELELNLSTGSRPKSWTF
jgi:monoamine oxidase